MPGEDLATTSLPAIERLENIPGEAAPQARTIASIRAAFEKAGVIFTDGDAPGVRLRKGPVGDPAASNSSRDNDE